MEASVEIKLFIVTLILSCVIVVIHSAQPRSTRFVDLDILEGEPLGQQAKLLQPPLAFSYNPQDSRASESVIKQRRYKPDPDQLPVLRKLSSKRMLIPKKYFRDAESIEKLKEYEEKEDVSDILENTELPSIQDVPYAPVQPGTHKTNEFLIYVPDEKQQPLNSYQVPIIVPDLSSEQQGDGKEVVVAETNSETKKVLEVKTDQNVQETHHKKHKPKPKPVNTKFEKGIEKDEKSEHHASSKKKGDKGYKGEHTKYKVEKAHHKEEDKSGKYAEKGSDDKKFNHGDDYEAGEHEEESGKKKSKYEEEAENDKGHATKGTHNIRKKDEYVKKIEFFDEYHEDSDEDEDGDHEDDEDYKKGHHDHKEHRDSAFEYDKYDEKKKHDDGDFEKSDKGKHHAASHDKHHDHDNKQGKQSKHGNKKIWKIIVMDKN